MRSDLLPLPREPRWRRLFGVVVFVGLLAFFRHLAPVLICFVILVRALGWVADELTVRTGLSRARGVAGLLGALGLSVATATVIGARMAMPVVRTLRVEGRGRLEELSHHPQVEWLRHLGGGEGGGDVVGTMKHHAMDALHYATAFAHSTLYVLIGLLLAVLYLFEHEGITAWLRAREPWSIAGTLARWMGYLADAIIVMVRMQGVTAVVNGVITLPVLVALRLPHVGLLFLFIVVTGLVPVVGNFISGAVLCAVAFEERGAWAVGVFVAVTFVLHKIESYFLTPRLASQHVELPGLLLVLSLLLFEQTFGFWGLFLSFPSLYVAQRIHNEWKSEVETERGAGGGAVGAGAVGSKEG